MSMFNNAHPTEEIEVCPHKEHHKYQAKYIEIPIEIVKRVEDEQITIKEAWLLAIINALIVYGEEGCWASDKYLAKKIQVQPRQVQRYLGSLISLDLLTSEMIDGKRCLKPCWIIQNTQKKVN